MGIAAPEEPAVWRVRVGSGYEDHVVADIPVTVSVEIGEHCVEHTGQLRFLRMAGEARLEIEPLTAGVPRFDGTVAVQQDPGTGSDRYLLGDTVGAEAQRERRAGGDRLDVVAIGE